MTKQEAIEKHRKMWNWLADNPGKSKSDYLEIYEPIVWLLNDCYLCEYANDNCDDCPLQWPHNECSTHEQNGLFDEWIKEMVCYEDYVRAAEIAKQIAQLPEKEE